MILFYACLIQITFTQFANQQVLVDNYLTLSWQYTSSNLNLMIQMVKGQPFAIGFNTRLDDNIDREFWSFNYDFKFTPGWANLQNGIIENAFYTSDCDSGVQVKQSYTDATYAYVSMTVLLNRTNLTNCDHKYDFSIMKDINISYFRGDDLFLSYERGIALTYLSQQKPPNSDKWNTFVTSGHSIFMFILWGCLSDVGIFFGRYMKSYPKYAKVHGIIFSFQGIITYVFFFSKISYQIQKIQEINFYDNLTIAHFAIGVIGVVLMTIQMLMGVLLKANLESKNGSHAISRVKYIHQVLGYSLYLIMKIQVALGVMMYVESYNIKFWFYAYYLLLIMVKISTEILYHYEVSLIPRERISYSKVELENDSIYQQLVDRINAGIPRAQLLQEFDGIIYVILREAIYDISDFNHPGGQYILEQIQGQEIGRYFYGAVPINNVIHKHKSYAINYIETRYIGEFRNDQCQILYEQDTDNSIERNIWYFDDVLDIDSETALFKFKNNHFRVNEQLKGVEWFGRYFYVKPYGAGVEMAERPYSVVMSYSEISFSKREYLLAMFDYLRELKDKEAEGEMNNDVLNPRPDKPEFPALSNTIHFIVKQHPQSQNLSRYLHCTSHKPYEITGPYGFGLQLTQFSDGLHYAFVNGTGILPFLDLIDYLLKRQIYKLAYEQIGQQEAKLLKQDEDFLNTFGPKFKFILHASFKDKDHFLGKQLAEDLLFICQTYQMPIFELHTRFSDEDNFYFDDRYMQHKLKYAATKIYVCGSNQFETAVRKALNQRKVPSRIIVSV